MSTTFSIPGSTVDPNINTFDFASYTLEQLQALGSELEIKNEFLALENTAFEDYYSRCNASPTSESKIAKKKYGIYSKLNLYSSKKEENTPSERYPVASQEGHIPNDNGGGPVVKRRRGEKAKAATEVLLLLTSEQKSEIVTRELEELRDDLERRRSEWVRILDNQRAELEELEVSHAELKKDQYEFRRDIVQGAVDKRTRKIMAEKVIRYFEDRMRSKDTTLEKIRLKNATLKSHKKKLMLQLKQKEEMDEVLHAIDFDQLKIENHQYLAKIEERNAELLKLKLVSGNIVQVMNVYKGKLNVLEEESLRLRSETRVRLELLDKLRNEAEHVAQDYAKALKINKTLVMAGNEFSVPSVMEYVTLKTQQEDLRNKVKSWRRKVEIAQMSAHWGMRDKTKTLDSGLNRNKSVVQPIALFKHPKGLSKSWKVRGSFSAASIKSPNLVGMNRRPELCGLT